MTRQPARHSLFTTTLLITLAVVMVASTRSIYLLFIAGWPTLHEATSFLRQNFFDLTVVTGGGQIDDGFVVFASIIFGLCATFLFAAGVAMLDLLLKGSTNLEKNGRRTKHTPQSYYRW